MIMCQIDDDNDQVSFLVMVIEPENLERMQQADPITLETAIDGDVGFLRPIKYPSRVRVLVAYEAKPGPLYALAKDGKVREMLKYVIRGYKYRSEDGIGIEL